jgi:hypothetical protein
MLLAAEQNFENRHPLWGDPAMPFAQFGEDLVEALLRFFHEIIAPRLTAANRQ